MIGKNIAVIRGNVTKKPIVRYTPDKYPVAFFTIAENYSVRTEDNNWETRVNFIDIAAFGSVAARAEKSLDKGYAVECECKIKPRLIEDKQSGKKYKTNEIIANRITILAKPRIETPPTATETPEPDTTETNAELPDETNATHDEELEEEEESPEDCEHETYEDDGTFDDYLKYSLVDQIREMAARNPAYYQ